MLKIRVLIGSRYDGPNNTVILARLLAATVLIFAVHFQQSSLNYSGANQQFDGGIPSVAQLD